MGSGHASSVLLDRSNHIIDHIIDTNLSSGKSLSSSGMCTFICSINSDGFSGMFKQKKEVEILDEKWYKCTLTGFIVKL